jgi:hypothetical protein
LPGGRQLKKFGWSRLDVGARKTERVVAHRVLLVRDYSARFRPGCQDRLVAGMHTFGVPHLQRTSAAIVEPHVHGKRRGALIHFARWPNRDRARHRELARHLIFVTGEAYAKQLSRVRGADEFMPLAADLHRGLVLVVHLRPCALAGQKPVPSAGVHKQGQPVVTQ